MNMRDPSGASVLLPTSTMLEQSDVGLEYALWLTVSVRQYFQVTPVGGRGISIQPTGALERRTDLLPVAVWDVSSPHGPYKELNVMMGRLHFSPGAQAPKVYQPFSHDEFRRLRALYLTAETSAGFIEEKRDLAAVVQHFAGTVLPQPLAGGLPSAPSIFTDVATPFERTTGQTDFPELAWLYILARCRADRDRSVLEIGSYQGRSACVLAAALRDETPAAHVISVDPHGDVSQHRDIVRLNVETTGEVVRLIQIQDSAENLGTLFAPDAVSMVFVDGDHSYDAVARDIECADRWLRAGGWIVFHDYWPQEHVKYEVEPRLIETVRAIRDSGILATGYRPLGAVKATIAYQKLARNYR
jgi:predicted O-methyltransferase YrrM